MSWIKHKGWCALTKIIRVEMINSNHGLQESFGKFPLSIVLLTILNLRPRKFLTLVTSNEYLAVQWNFSRKSACARNQIMKLRRAQKVFEHTHSAGITPQKNAVFSIICSQRQKYCETSWPGWRGRGGKKKRTTWVKNCLKNGEKNFVRPQKLFHQRVA